MRNFALITALLLMAAPAFADDAALWRALASGGHVALMRHASAPGIGDPANFALGDCSTQRNLSDDGRAEARAVGELSALNGSRSRRSRPASGAAAATPRPAWASAPVVEDTRLNSFFGRSGQGGRGGRGVEAAVAEAPRSGPIAVFVTHQVNITARDRVYPASGEIVVGQDSGRRRHRGRRQRSNHDLPRQAPARSATGAGETTRIWSRDLAARAFADRISDAGGASVALTIASATSSSRSRSADSAASS